MSTSSVIWNRTVPRSRVFDALSLVVSAGEVLVIDTIEHWRRTASHGAPPNVLIEADRLIREEAAHRRAHERYNAALILATPGAARVADRARQATAELAHLNLATRLALVVAFEQLTVALSREVLRRPDLLPAADTRHTRMWRWHAAEEIAHGHIAALVATHHGIGRLRLTLALCTATVYLAIDIVRGTFTLCRCDLAAGYPRLRFARDIALFTISSLPSLARMAAGLVMSCSRAAPRPSAAWCSPAAGGRESLRRPHVPPPRRPSSPARRRP